MRVDVYSQLMRAGWFGQPGAYVLVDGQFGSTGKGVAAAVLAEYSVQSGNLINNFITNAGPNSGHTAMWGDAEVMTQQIPIAAVFYATEGFLQKEDKIILNGGAIVDPDQLIYEIETFGIPLVHVHPCAAIIKDKHRQQEQDNGSARIAGTGKGVGAAIADKVNREGNLAMYHDFGTKSIVHYWIARPTTHELRYNTVAFIETAQGFSLGINEPRFAPHTTSRECTVNQALSDARIGRSHVQNVMMVCRTFPIRVGNTDKGESGKPYPDQVELSWDQIGQTPELTTVTKRVRRVFSWSRIQFMEALEQNEPDSLFINFMNYLKPDQIRPFLTEMLSDYRKTLGYGPRAVLLGWGPRNEDVTSMEGWL